MAKDFPNRRAQNEIRKYVKTNLTLHYNDRNGKNVQFIVW